MEFAFVLYAIHIHEQSCVRICFMNLIWNEEYEMYDVTERNVDSANFSYNFTSMMNKQGKVCMHNALLVKIYFVIAIKPN